MVPRKLFFIILPIFVVLAGGILFASVKNFLTETRGCPCGNLENATGEFESGEKEAFFESKKINPPLAVLSGPSFEEQKVLGESTMGEKWIEIDLSEQKLRAWESGNLFLETLISSGKPWTPTITGEFRIWSKFQYAKMEGGERGTKSYYYLPNVPYIMYFHKDFGLHGTYWHSNFGIRMSHGCVNLPTPVAEKLFYWTGPTLEDGRGVARATKENPGTRIVIHE